MTSGCAAPAARYDSAAQTSGFSELLVTGQRFHHKIYRNGGPVQNGVLHVFIEGDVSVKQALRKSPPDPTPRGALMLQMMHHDTAGAVLLGRPCHHGLYVMDQCEVQHIGPERYSAETVDSMQAALQNEMRHSEADRAVLVGYSGGGTLAMLLAGRMHGVAAVVTLAGNLDNTALVDLHGGPPLTGSLDPASLPPLPPSVLQLHFFGELDENVPASAAQNTLTRQNAAPIIMRGFDHECCWETIWPEILMRLRPVLDRSSIDSRGKAE